MTARTAHPSMSMDRTPGHGTPSDAIAADPDLALARWENEGGVPARLPQPGQDPRSAAGTEPGKPHPGPITPPPTTTPRDDRSPTMRRPPRVRVGRVYDERAAADGTRVLVDRLWPRGLAKARADIDEWCKQIAPSSALRRWYGHDPARFVEFRQRYETELDDPSRAPALGHLRELARKGTLTLLTATRQAEISEAAVLTDLLNAEPGIA
jgi:uncharacterized protein YeaO (DUF488 family)